MSLSKLPIINNIVELSKRFSIPGFSGISIYNVSQFVYSEAVKEDNDIVTRANSIAFNFFLSLFPLMIFLFTLLPHFPIATDFISFFKESSVNFLPDQAHKYLFEVIDDVASIRRKGLLSFGFILAIIFSSSGMVTLMYGFHKSYDDVFKKRSYLRTRSIAIGLTMIVAFLFVVSLCLIIFGTPLLTFLIDKLEVGQFSVYVLNFFSWLIVISVIYTSITFIYRYGPAMKQRISWFNTGAVLATMLSIATSVAFSFFINSFGRYNEIYGSIGALIVLLLWIQINVFIILIGFEFNACIAVNMAKIIKDNTIEEIVELEELQQFDTNKDIANPAE